MPDKVQPKVSLRFRSKVPEWNGDVVYKTLGALERAVRNIPEMVPPHVLEVTDVTRRDGGGVSAVDTTPRRVDGSLR